jgi:hypothetical protein
MARLNRLLILTVAVAFAARLDAGLTYRTETTTEGVRPHAFNGIVKIESGHSRFEVIKSDEKMFETGSIILSSAKDNVATVLNPARKTYYVVDFAKIASSVAETQKQLAPWMTMQKPVATVKNEGPGGLVQGYPTQRWVIDSSMDMKMHAPADNGARRITTRSEIWTTEKLPAEASSIIQNSQLPGDPIFDAIHDAHAKMKGFTLKSVTVTRMTIGGSTTSSTSRTNVTAIRAATFPSSDFVIPAGYKKVDSPIDAMLSTLGAH